MYINRHTYIYIYVYIYICICVHNILCRAGLYTVLVRSLPWRGFGNIVKGPG